MSSFGFGKLNGNQITYIDKLNIRNYYAARGSFIAVKMLQKMMLQFSTSGKLIFSNNELMSTFGSSRRGIQMAMTSLEDTGILTRTFADPETKYIRTGFILDVDMSINWLKATKKDVQELKRGSLKKHFAVQSVIKVVMFAKELKKLMRAKKNTQDRKDIQKKLERINLKKAEYNRHVKSVLKRQKKYLNIVVEQADKETLMAKLIESCKAWGYTPPDMSTN